MAKSDSFLSRLPRYLIAATKLTKLAKAFKVLSALKSAKVFVSLGSMLVSIVAYSAAMEQGWKLALGFVIMLLLHEIGHVIAAYIRTKQVHLPVFIPFLGAAIFIPVPKDKDEEAFIGFGGPLLGTAAAAAVFGLWAIIPSHPPILLMISYVALFLNLFNLIPIRPLDGGRITQAASSFFAYVGGALLLAFPIIVGDPGLLVLWLLVLHETKTSNAVKFFGGLACQALMLGLMLSEYWTGNNIVDLILATFFNLIGWAQWKFCGEQFEYSTVPAPMSIRIKWATLYVAMVTTIVLLMIWEHQYMPQGFSTAPPAKVG